MESSKSKIEINNVIIENINQQSSALNALLIITEQCNNTLNNITISNVKYGFGGIL